MDNSDPNIENEASLNSANDLTAANNELAFQFAEKEKRAAELIIANKELLFQNEEKEKRAAELVIANKELLFQNEEKEKRAAELQTANKELLFQNEEKEKRATELITANYELKKAEDKHIVHIKDLEDMMFMISHKVRLPVANILGLSELINVDKNNPEELKKLLILIKESVQLLDNFTGELSAFIHAKIES